MKFKFDEGLDYIVASTNTVPRSPECWMVGATQLSDVCSYSLELGPGTRPDMLLSHSRVRKKLGT